MCFLLPAVPCLHTFGSFEAIIMLSGLSTVQITQDKVMQSVHVLYVVQVRLEGLGLFSSTAEVSGFLKY